MPMATRCHPPRRGGGGVGGEIWVIRNDGGAYQAGLDAITADLDEIGAAYGVVDYAPGIATDFNDAGALVAIWYRGGPGASGETQPYTTMWTTDEIDDYIQIMADAHQILCFTQGHGTHWICRTPRPMVGPHVRCGADAGHRAGRRGPASLGAGYDTSDGVGFGGSYGFVPDARRTSSAHGRPVHGRLHGLRRALQRHGLVG